MIKFLLKSLKYIFLVVLLFKVAQFHWIFMLLVLLGISKWVYDNRAVIPFNYSLKISKEEGLRIDKRTLRRLGWTSGLTFLLSLSLTFFCMIPGFPSLLTAIISGIITILNLIIIFSMIPVQVHNDL